MDLIKGYGSDSDSDGGESTSKETIVNKNVEIKQITSFKPTAIAPSVQSIRVSENKIDPNSKSLTYNATYDQMYGETEGPHTPYSRSKQRMDPSLKNHKTGIIEDFHINDFAFSEQYHTFKSYGYAKDPSNSNVVIGNLNNYRDGVTVYNGVTPNRNNSSSSSSNNNNNGDGSGSGSGKKKRQHEDPGDIKGYQGPWGSKDFEIELKAKIAEEDKQDAKIEMNDVQKQYLDMRAKQQKKTKETPETSATMHREKKLDYMGRSWLEPPSELRAGVNDSYLPKKLIHTWTGHTKGVSAIRLLPKYGNLLLSASMDTTVKIWDVYNERDCIQTYMGHQQAVRDISFANDGRQFLSCGYDRVTRLWDTETGKVISSYTNGSTPYCIKFNPDDDKQNEFLVGGSDRKILQYDTKSNQIVQEYDQHLGAINSLTFIDDNRRFVSSSDDKSMRIWEWGIPVVIKYISDPEMHSMPAVALHPKGKWFAGQSMDNQILVYRARDKFRMNKKKRFLGHTNAGYACQLNFSPDGKYIVSGDASGKAYFWDWKTSKVYKTLQAHDDVCIGIEWHPIESSKVNNVTETCCYKNTLSSWETYYLFITNHHITTTTIFQCLV
ncbi:WD40 repeat-containing protein [Heterostelium album PN500]|uniref:Pre-mRNA-processing factor 17 n=1 Tax=Heterostelium pallidum (strain ATCC 26659 / Pp 5 / PN500) TaxID=670386 RepID=D3AYY7_HETP5|nr:WD40 repeat-containing protein [Heterostelium album PN500]EFA85677.1 WD40 repeat-containing protein [Heterostelium album PN500]|eukprot:XP_020437784.1 WD40 repeat-containing protein [Heterostelium album PN500]